MRKKKIQWSTILLIVILVIGLSLLLYPTFSDWWNSMHQTRAIASYTEQVAGMDYCTLVTCTPYGVNSHRLLVRGHRIDTVLEETHVVRVTADAVQIEPMVVAPIVAAPMLLILLIALLIPKPRKNRRKDG